MSRLTVLRQRATQILNSNKTLLLLVLLVIVAVFRKYFFHGLLPIPADLLPGAYYPWFDNKWGFPVHVPVKNPLPSDVVSIMLPSRFVGINLLKSGHLPLWDNTILLGAPLLANFQAALLNPVNLLYFILPFYHAWSVQVLIQIPLLIVGQYLFLKDLKLSTEACVFGAVIWAFSGYSMVWLVYNSLMYVASYLPFVLLFTRRLYVSGKYKWLFWLGIVVALQLLSGYPLTVFYTLGLATLYIGVELFWSTKQRMRSTVYWLTGLLVAVGLAAVQLIPSAELSGLSVYQFDNVAQAGGVKFLPLVNLVTFFFPDFFGNPGTGNPWGLGSYDNFSFFVASVGVYCIIVGLVSRYALGKKFRFFAVTFLLGLLLATQNPISKMLMLFDALGLHGIAYSRALILSVFASSALAAAGIEALIKQKVTLLVKLIPLLIYASLTVATYLIKIKYEANIQLILDKYSEMEKLGELQAEIYQIAGGTITKYGGLAVAVRNTIAPLALVTFSTVIALLIKNKRLMVLGFLTVFAIGSVYSYDKYLTFMRPDIVYPATELTDFLTKTIGHHRFERERAELMPPNSWSVYGLKSPSGQDAQAPITSAGYINLINTKAAKNEVLTRFVELKDLGSPLVRTLDIEYFLALNRDEKDLTPNPAGAPLDWLVPEGFTEVNNIGSVRVYKNTDNLGPAWFGGEIRCESDTDKIAAEITKTDYDPSKVVYADCDNSISNLDRGSVSLLGSESGHFEFATQSTTANYLTVSATYFPGWQAYVDGVSTEIHVANTALMSVFVDRGVHEVEFVYDPKSVKTGFVVSTIFALVTLLGLTNKFKRLTSLKLKAISEKLLHT